jgi:hypothetical protein
LEVIDTDPADMEKVAGDSADDDPLQPKWV